jgi:DMSO reductase family type II enzyme chaperone
LPIEGAAPPLKRWEAKPAETKRSVFGNYRAGESTPAGRQEAGAPGNSRRVATAEFTPASLQTSIDTALARAFLHRFLATAFQDPTDETWQWLGLADTRQTFWAAVKTLAQPALESAALAVARALTPDGFETFRDDYVAAFGHASRGGCPLNEIEYGDLKADPLFQPHRLADLAAFYRAFGLEVGDDAGERHDHLSIELEFLSVLAAKEAYALEHQFDDDQLAVCRDAQKQFLREHLGRWSPAFARRLAAQAADSPLAALAHLLRVFIESQCARFALPPGSEDLLLRPVDDSLERLCDACGLRNLPPGALAAGATT